MPLSPQDRVLIGDLLEAKLLLSVDPTLPENRSISSWIAYQDRSLMVDAINRALDRIWDLTGVTAECEALDKRKTAPMLNAS